MTGILNPPVEAAACRAMIAAAREEMATAERDLTHALLPHDKYLQTFGRAQAARAIVARLEHIYAANFKV